MTDEKIIVWTIIAVALIISSWNITHIHTESKFSMDENTMTWLTEHNYCLMGIHQKYDSELDRPDVTFIGECEYLNYTIIAINGG